MKNYAASLVGAFVVIAVAEFMSRRSTIEAHEIILVMVLWLVLKNELREEN